MIFSIITGGFIINLVILFVIVFFCSLGTPGGMITLVSLGALSNNITELIIVIIIGAIAAILGDITAYALARKFSTRLASWLKKFKFYRNNELRAKEQFSRSEFLMVFLTRFLFTGLCAVVSYISGIERLNKKKFIIAVITGEILYAAIYPFIGFIFKETWNDIISFISSTITVFLLLLLTLLIVYFVIKRSGKRLQK